MGRRGRLLLRQNCGELITMKKWRGFLIIALICLPDLLIAQPDPFNCSAALSAAASKNILTSVQSRYRGVQSFEAEFAQESHLSSLNDREFSKGRLSFQNNAMRWHYISPEEEVFLAKDRTIWYYQVLDRQVLIQNFSERFSSDLPLSFLLGIGDLERDFTLLKRCRAGKNYLIELSPKKDSEELKRFQLLVRADDFVVVGAKLNDAVGNSTAFILSITSLNKALTEDLFAANFPAGVDIIDKRTDDGNS